MRIFPKEIDFFEIFDKAASNLTKATSLLVSLMENFDNLEARAKEIYEVEQDGDMLTHDIMKKMNRTFITPIDREDIHALASRMDDILDLVWGGVDRMIVFKITEPTPQAVELAKDLHQTTEVLQKTIKELRSKNYSHVQEHCIEINRLENRIDRTFRDALGKLFDDMKDDPLLIIKWKEIYEHLEDASDRCEDVANVLEGIVLKNA
jgi:predicted phosphate transport protein (TIGR00153 family)